MVLYYQPVYDVYGGVVSGMEALIRWNDPERGLVPPDQFIPAAEASGLIDEIGLWVIDEVCRQSRIWADQGFTPAIGFNVAPRELRRDDFARSLAAAIRRHGADPRRLVLEITERAAMREPERTDKVVRDVKALGARVAIDDFGADHSSLARLRAMKVDILKIDRSFLRRRPGGARGLVDRHRDPVAGARARDGRGRRGRRDRGAAALPRPERLPARAGVPHRSPDARRAGDGVPAPPTACAAAGTCAKRRSGPTLGCMGIPTSSGLRVSVLDQSPVSEGSTGSQALRNTIDLAQLADELGYHRYWVAEHHGGGLVAGPAPEVLIGPIAAATTRLRVGSGGVMLPHYSPLKVAESSACWPGCSPAASTSGSAARPAPTR